MEKGNTSGLRIAITGPESTGKSVLADQLANRFCGVAVPEYARGYIKTIDRPYSYADVEFIARGQIEQYRGLQRTTQPVFFDTWLIITKVWFDWVYQTVPVWLEDAIHELPIDLYLLMLPDLPWIADPLRENGGESRMRLFERYKQELDTYGFPYVEIGGVGETRFLNAESVIHSCCSRKNK